jgi:hypothetical protein
MRLTVITHSLSFQLESYTVLRNPSVSEFQQDTASKMQKNKKLTFQMEITQRFTLVAF